ncbi:methionine biosynthesis protein MetW [Candidatus Saganbacteria bacterium]|nr:methionine biosynthesis protein MetW [Candidatus Saganbacteria bacterium]
MSNLIEKEHSIIAGMVGQGATVLDLGCGHGDLLALLAEQKQIKGQGIEIDQQAIYDCVAKGLSVFHGDIDSGLPEFGDRAFDYVILSQSMQQVKKPDTVLTEALRVGKKAIVSFPNFAHLSARLQLGIFGKVPVNPSLPFEWYNTPNTHFLSFNDFINYCRKRGIKIEKQVYLNDRGRVRILPNILGMVGIFLISKR